MRRTQLRVRKKLLKNFEFKYDSSGVLTEGTEVVNGETIEYGADFEVTSVTADTSGLTALSEEAFSIAGCNISWWC